MNRLKGNIHSVVVSGKMSVVTVEIAKDTMLKSIVIDTPESASYLKKGREIFVLFKETEVIISTDQNPNISIQNIISGKITSLEKGTLLSELVINIGQSDIIAIIPTSAIEALKLHTQMVIKIMIKLNEIMLSD